jgi:hypothetical protein
MTTIAQPREHYVEMGKRSGEVRRLQSALLRLVRTDLADKASVEAAVWELISAVSR